MVRPPPADALISRRSLLAGKVALGGFRLEAGTDPAPLVGFAEALRRTNALLDGGARAWDGLRPSRQANLYVANLCVDQAVYG